jgi:hypothetical protein
MGHEAERKRSKGQGAVGVGSADTSARAGGRGCIGAGLIIARKDNGWDALSRSERRHWSARPSSLVGAAGSIRPSAERLRAPPRRSRGRERATGFHRASHEMRRTNPSMRVRLSSEAVQILWSGVPAHPLRRRLQSIWLCSDLAMDVRFVQPATHPLSLRLREIALPRNRQCSSRGPT